MWAYESVFYQIYPLGLCGAPKENDGVAESRILQIKQWSDYIRDLGVNAVYFTPVFESDSHGYNTRDFCKLDCRLGTNADFAAVCEDLHEHGLKVVLDGVFHHVGRGFWAFQDVLKNRQNSPYRDWFHISFEGSSPYGDNLWYEGWEGHFDLVKLNLQNEEVVRYLLDCVKGWIEEFSIDGLRLDVAYSLPADFITRLRSSCDSLKQDFFLVGEVIHGDYNAFLGDGKLHSVTNYECYKGLYSSFNSKNSFEIVHSLLRQFGAEPWCLYRGKHLLNFVDNHDVTRIASLLDNANHLPLIYALLLSMPGIPCLYYGSEWGAEGRKGSNSDDDLRPTFAKPQPNELTAWIAKLAKAHHQSKALCYGSFQSLVLTNQQMIFERSFEQERVLVAINMDSSPYIAHFNANAGRAVDLITGELHDFGGGSELAPYSAAFWKIF